MIEFTCKAITSDRFYFALLMTVFIGLISPLAVAQSPEAQPNSEESNSVFSENGEYAQGTDLNDGGSVRGYVPGMKLQSFELYTGSTRYCKAVPETVMTYRRDCSGEQPEICKMASSVMAHAKGRIDPLALITGTPVYNEAGFKNIELLEWREVDKAERESLLSAWQEYTSRNMLPGDRKYVLRVLANETRTLEKASVDFAGACEAGTCLNTLFRVKPTRASLEDARYNWFLKKAPSGEFVEYRTYHFLDIRKSVANSTRGFVGAWLSEIWIIDGVPYTQLSGDRAIFQISSNYKNTYYENTYGMNFEEICKLK